MKCLNSSRSWALPATCRARDGFENSETGAYLDIFRPVIQTGRMKISATEFKAKCLALIDQVHESGKPVLITKRGRVVASLIPQEDLDHKPWLLVRGTVQWQGDAL